MKHLVQTPFPVLAAVLALALLSRPADATDAWGRFVAHVIQISDSSGNVEVHVVTTPEANLDLAAPSNPFGLGPSIYHLDIAVPEFTARGLMYEVADPPDAESFVDFAPYSNTIPMSVTMSADVSMSPLTEDDTIHWEDPGVEKVFQAVVGVNGPAQFVQNLSFLAAGGSGSVGGPGTSDESFISERGDPFITDLSTHLPEWGTNPALREVNRFDLIIDARVLRQTGGDPEILRSLASFVLSVTTIYELVLDDPDPFPEPDPNEPYLEVIAVSGPSNAARAGRAYQTAIGMKLQTADRIVTELGSTVTLRYPDGVVVEVKGGTDLAIEALHKTGPTVADIVAETRITVGELFRATNYDRSKSSMPVHQKWIQQIMYFGGISPDPPSLFAEAAMPFTALPALNPGAGSVQPYEDAVFSITVTYTPDRSTTIKVSSGKVRVTSGLPDMEPFDLESFETVRITESEVENLDLPRPRIAVSQPRRFPVTRLRRTSRPQQLTISNAAGASFHLADLTVGVTGRAARDFRVGSPPRSVLAPGESTSVGPVTFRPLRKGVRRATLTVRGNAAPAGVTLLGTGKAAAKSKK